MNDSAELVLPPGQEQVDASATSTFMRSMDVHAIFPHMHKLGRTLHQELKRNEETTCLVDVPDWSFDWQQFYFYDAAPIRLEVGGTLQLTCEWERPIDETVYWGEGSEDEMCIVGLYVTP